METLENKGYKKFIEEHVLRPYQNYIFPESHDAKNFTNLFYELIPEFMAGKPEWSNMVFNRLSQIYETVDANIFPPGLTGTLILAKMHEKGIKIRY